MQSLKRIFIFSLFLILTVPGLMGSQVNRPQMLCDNNLIIAEILNQTTQTTWTQWIKDLSGENNVQIESQDRLIATRYSQALFDSNPKALAYPYLIQELEDMGYQRGETLIEHAYTGVSAATWKNIILIVPGHGTQANESVLMTAHMDSISTDSLNLAPGAEDNGSGVATLLEAARLFRHYQFDRTVKIIFFTGEEQGLYGSRAYVADHSHELSNIVGVVNLDMFGYDDDDDHCFELHIGTLTASDTIGQCFVNTINAYGLNLSYDYLTDSATTYSDHASFWDEDVGAIEVLENFYDNGQLTGCVGSDRNPHYHKTTDTLDNMNLPTAFEIAKGGIATTAGLAGPLATCFSETPTLTAINGESSINLTWTAVSGADTYLIYRSNDGCSGSWDIIARTESQAYQDTSAIPGASTAYQVEAGTSSGICLSYPSSCQTATITGLDYFIPLIAHQQ